MLFLVCSSVKPDELFESVLEFGISEEMVDHLPRMSYKSNFYYMTQQ